MSTLEHFPYLEADHAETLGHREAWDALQLQVVERLEAAGAAQP